MTTGYLQFKTFHIGFKRHFISLKRRMVRLTSHSVVKDLTIFSRYRLPRRENKPISTPQYII